MHILVAPEAGAVYAIPMPNEEFSFSRITTFEQCARRYRYRYLDGVQEAFRGVEAFMGQQVHSTIEWMFEERDAGCVREAKDCVARYCEIWDAELLKSTRQVRIIKDGFDLEYYRRKGAEMVSSFYQARFSRDRLKTIANEMYFKIELSGGHAFRGFIDRVARDEEGRLHIIDYKTGRQMKRGFVGKEADQLRAYGFAYLKNSDDAEVVLEIDFLQTGRKESATLARDEIDPIEDQLTTRIDKAIGSTVFPLQTGPLCRWCGFNDICDGYAAAPAPRQRRQRA